MADIEISITTSSPENQPAAEDLPLATPRSVEQPTDLKEDDKAGSQQEENFTEKSSPNTPRSDKDQASPTRSRPLSSISHGQSSQTEEASLKSARSRDSSQESKRRRAKKAANTTNTHRVTFTVTIAKAFPTDEEEMSGGDGAEPRRRKRIVEAPRAQNYLHCEYNLLPDDDETVRTDVVTYGLAAKIYTERQDAKVLKTWADGELTWVAWTHAHTVNITDDLLKKLIKHNVEFRVWDTRDKLSTRARYDRPKAFKLPAAKPGEDADAAGGVKALVLGQCARYAQFQPKKSYIDRPMPSQTQPMSEDELLELRMEKVQPLPQPPNHQRVASCQQTSRSTRAARRVQRQSSPTPSTLVQVPASKLQPGDNNLRSYSRLGRLAGVAPPTEPQQEKHPSTTRSRTQTGPSPKQSSKAKSSSRTAIKATNTADTDSSIDSQSHTPVKRDTGTRPRKNKKLEAAAQAQAEHVKKHGMCCIPVQMAKLFAGMDSICERLPKPVNSLEDMFVTVSISGPIMSDEQKRNLNPLILKVQSATDMPGTPIPYEELRLRCQPAYIKYRLFEEERTSIGREQDKSIYWDDINVVLAGTMEPSRLREYLNGPLLEIAVHDRDRMEEKQQLKPTLFGDDLEDEKISNVGTVSSKRTIHSPFIGKDKPWDPYGVAKVDLSGLLLGQQVIHMKVPIHQCSVPDVLGMHDGKQDGKLIGVAGAVDGPSETPLAAGHYLASGASLKVKVEVSHPLVTPNQLAAKSYLETTTECPFARIVYKFDYKNMSFLHKLLDFVTDVNALALEMTDMPPAVIKAALTTYKLSVEQQTCPTLDLVTGFQILDGTMHLFVLEGLRDGAILTLWETMPQQQNSDIEVLYNSDLAFSSRLYGSLDVDLCRIKLHEPLAVITQQPLLYVRDMVPKPCFQALVKLDELTMATKLRDAVRNDLLPAADMVQSMSKEFGVPLTDADIEELESRFQHDSDTDIFQVVSRHKRERTHQAIDNNNEQYMEKLKEREEIGPNVDFEKANKNLVREKSILNSIERSKTMPATMKIPYQSVKTFNYSSQRLNSTEQAKESLRQLLAKNPDVRYTYCPEYHHSMTVIPVNTEAMQKQEAQSSEAAWKTPNGWVYPGKKTMVESNVHPRKLHPARAEALQQPWEDLSRLPKGKPVSRSRYTWSSREKDMDLWTRPHPVFGKDEPITIHLAGQKLKQEQKEASEVQHSIWHNKVVVADTRSHFHRCATETELKDSGFKSGNQVDRLQGLLKDPPQKYSLRKPGLATQHIPPLNVVLNPSVDSETRELGLDVSPAVKDEFDPKIKGYVPGPHDLSSWVTNGNQVPVVDYEHSTFIREKGYDFNVYHKERTSLYKGHINPLTDSEYRADIFRCPPRYDHLTGKEVLPHIGSYSNQVTPAIHAT